MRKILLFGLLLSLFVTNKVAAQCDVIPVLFGTQRHVHDTTYIPVYVDTTIYGTVGYSYQWVLQGGSIHTGSTAEYFVTEAPNNLECHCIITGPGCTTNTLFYVSATVVFNCSQFFNAGWDEYTGTRQTGPQANDIAIGAYAPSFGDTGLKINLSLDWGNGHNIFLSQSTDLFWNIGGVDDTAHSSHYQYAGQYTLHASYYYSYDTLTCPVRNMDTVTIHAGGLPSIPVLYGATTYCAGDTLKLFAQDTTLQFHNLYHHSGIAGTRDFWNSYYYIDDNHGQYTHNSSIYYQWYDKNYNLLSTDTTLVAANLRVQDSGIYILRAVDGITNRDTETLIHIVITGSQLTLDSFVAPTCTATGTIYLNCHRANDSVTISYIKDSVAHTYAGRTNASGYTRISGLTEGDYSSIHAHFWGDACMSNIISGPFMFHSLPAPTSSVFSACAGGTISLTASSSVSGASFHWEGPGGFTSSLQNPVITAITTAAAGLYSVSIASGICTQSSITAVRVYVSSAVPDLSAAHFTDSVCSGTSFPLLGMPYGDLYLGTTFASSDTSVVNNFYQARRRGSAAITVTSLNACGSSSFTQTLHVKAGPTLPPLTGPATVCIGSVVTYNIATTGGTWSTVGAPISTDVVTDHSYRFVVGSTATRNPITYTKDSAGCRSTANLYYSMLDTTHRLFSPPVALYPGDTITPVVRIINFNYNYYGPYSGALAVMPTWTPVSGPIATISSAGLVTAGTQPGSVVMNVAATSPCTSVSDSFTAHVSDWIDSRFANGGVTDMVRDTAGNLFVLGNQIIRKIDRNRHETIIAGRAGTEYEYTDGYVVRAYSGDGGLAIDANLGNAQNITCDNAGNIYISSTADGVIRKIDHDGYITLFAGILGSGDWWPSAGYSGDGGLATAAHINATFMTTDNAGNLYFSDDHYHRIRKINAAGIITTFAGNGIVGTTGDGGAATSAQVGAPVGLAVDTLGNLIVSTMGRLRKINPSGIISTIAGSDSGCISGGHPATATRPIFAGPVVCDKLGNIFCVSYNNTLGWNGSYGYGYWYGYSYPSAYGFGYSYWASYSAYQNSTKRIDKNGIVSIVGANQQPYAEFPDAAPSVYTSAYHAVCVDDSGGVYIGGYGRTIRHSGKPSLEILASHDSICHGPAAITFTAQAHYTGSSSSYQWQKNGINVGTNNITYTDPSFAAGDTISCKVYLSAGGKYLAMAKRSVAIDENPPVVTAITGSAIVCEAATTTLANTAVGGTWSSSSSAATVAAGAVTGVSAGTAIVTYSVTNACGSASDTMLITVNPLPHAGTIAGATRVCETATTTLTNIVTGGTWSTSSSSVTLSGGAVTGLTTGTAVITYSVTNSCGTDTDTLEMTVNPLPQAGTITGATSVCAGNTITLTTTTTGGTWSSSAATVTVSGSAVTGVAAGPAIITYAVTNSCGTATDTMLVTVNALPSAGSITGSASVCQGADITLSNTTTGGTWSSSAPAATVAGGVVTGVSNGTAVIAYSVTNTCGTTIDTMQVTVNPLPVAGVIVGTDTLCLGSSAMLTASVTGGVWQSSDVTVGTISGTGTFAATSGGVVYVTYSVTNACGTSTASHTILVRSADECGPSGTYYTFNIYPNPSTGDITVEIPSPGTNAVITIMDITSRVIQTIHPPANQLLVPISLGNLPSATYMVKLQANGNVYIGKVVVD